MEHRQTDFVIQFGFENWIIKSFCLCSTTDGTFLRNLYPSRRRKPLQCGKSPIGKHVMWAGGWSSCYASRGGRPAEDEQQSERALQLTWNTERNVNNNSRDYYYEVSSCLSAICEKGECDFKCTVIAVAPTAAAALWNTKNDSSEAAAPPTSEDRTVRLKIFQLILELRRAR